MVKIHYSVAKHQSTYYVVDQDGNSVGEGYTDKTKAQQTADLLNERKTR